MLVNYQANPSTRFFARFWPLAVDVDHVVEVQVTRRLIGVRINLGIPRLRLQPRSSIKHVMEKRNCFLER